MCVFCSTLMRASYFLAPKKYPALLIGFGAVSFIINVIFDIFLFCLFLLHESSSVSIVASGRKKSCSSSATSVDCIFTFIGLIVISSRILSSTSFLGLNFKLIREFKESAAVFCVPATWKMWKLNCKT